MDLLLWAKHLTIREAYELPIKHADFLQHELSVGGPWQKVPGGMSSPLPPPAVWTLGKPPVNNGYFI